MDGLATVTQLVGHRTAGRGNCATAPYAAVSSADGVVIDVDDPGLRHDGLGDLVVLLAVGRPVPMSGARRTVPRLPESGQVVNIRGSTWAVAEVRQRGLPRSPADEGAAGLTHVVSLQPLEEDRLGQELAVV